MKNNAERTDVRNIRNGEVFHVDYGVRPGYYMPVGDAAITVDQKTTFVVDILTGIISRMNYNASVIRKPSDPDWEYPGPDRADIAEREHTTLDKLLPGSIFIPNGTTVCHMIAIDEKPRPGKRLTVNLRNGQLSELDENATVTKWTKSTLYKI